MRKFTYSVAVALAGIALACSGQDSPESIAEELEGNVEQATETMEDTYDEARDQGEGMIDAVLEEGDEETEE